MRTNRMFVTICLGLTLLTLTGSHAEQASATSKLYNADFIVMFGDSITYGGEWELLLRRSNIITDGVIGDTTSGFLKRIPNVYFFNPRICFIMGGINDIAKGVRVETIYENIRRMSFDLMERNTIPVIQSTLLTRKSKYNRKVHRLNAMLREFAEANDLDFIDLNPHLTTGEMLRRKFTFDGIHLHRAAYRIWAGEIEKVLDKYNL